MMGLVGICVVMAIGTYAIGLLPLFFHLSRNGLRMLELWGSGLLLGAALTVVIPEGIASVYKGSHICRDGQPIHQDSSKLTSKDLIAVCDQVQLTFSVDRQMLARMHTHHHATTLASNDQQQESENDTATYYPADERESNGWLPSSEKFLAALSGLLGLIIHALADGIALGASIGNQDASLQVVVVLAIMVHKAPASIGTCTLLMSRQLDSKEIRWALFVFSLATPVGALATYSVIQLFFHASGGSEATINVRDVGAILSFSGGTFLYVAMHAVLELTANPSECPLTEHSHHPHDSDHPIHARCMSSMARLPSVRIPRSMQPLSGQLNAWLSLSLVVLGSITPRLLQLLIGDHHGHVE
ncbi:hypothetical protein MPSI1_002966 [Malassezia psittaci]|uniref:Uncharacterized protein n=1 Tax=Malassezia psittaci TaxID=1821823 RepID=A0AAF0FD43_9BASI|nr:hypothetical protein MPSI1_002966 [Malassezia psittaci]